ncbi:hypothetical protein QOT17_022487 [Balamuthia mandrillaris]
MQAAGGGGTPTQAPLPKEVTGGTGDTGDTETTFSVEWMDPSELCFVEAYSPQVELGHFNPNQTMQELYDKLSGDAQARQIYFNHHLFLLTLPCYKWGGKVWSLGTKRLYVYQQLHQRGNESIRVPVTFEVRDEKLKRGHPQLTTSRGEPMDDACFKRKLNNNNESNVPIEDLDGAFHGRPWQPQGGDAGGLA